MAEAFRAVAGLRAAETGFDAAGLPEVALVAARAGPACGLPAYFEMNFSVSAFAK